MTESTAPAMRLMHFSNAATITMKSRRQDESPGFKPRGFWVSDEAEHGWSAWTAAEEYGIGRNAFSVALAEDAEVLTLTTTEAVRAFNAEFGANDRYYIDWQQVAERWQGIIITPYQWELRLSREVNWYYPWDCASGCIWDAAAIAAVTAVEVVAR